MSSVLQFIHFPRRLDSCFLLFIFWISGLFFGIGLFCSNSIEISSLMHGLHISSVSIVSLIIAVLFPFLFSAFAVYFSFPWIVLPISFIKAAGYSFLSMSILSFFGTSGWLIRFLIMFHDIIICPVWYAFNRRFLRDSTPISFAGWLGITALVVLIVILEYRAILPIYSGAHIL